MLAVYGRGVRALQKTNGQLQRIPLGAHREFGLARGGFLVRVERGLGPAGARAIGVLIGTAVAAGCLVRVAAGQFRVGSIALLLRSGAYTRSLSAQLQPCLSQENTLHTLHTP